VVRHRRVGPEQLGANFIVAQSFLPLVALIGRTTVFWILAGICIVAALFIYFLVPETKGRSLEQIETDLRKRSRSAPKPDSLRGEVVVSSLRGYLRLTRMETYDGGRRWPPQRPGEGVIAIARLGRNVRGGRDVTKGGYEGV
jgi:Sugar (and other) transporter